MSHKHTIYKLRLNYYVKKFMIGAEKLIIMYRGAKIH